MCIRDRLIGFADQIADSLLGPNFEQDTKDTLSRGLQGGGLGMLLGKRFILPFAALNALATDENKKMLKDIGSNLKENWDGFAKQVAPVLGFLPSFDNILKTISTGTTNGLKAIKGFTESGFQSEEFKTNWVSGVGLLGTVAALLMPGKFAKGLKFLARFAGSKKGAVLLALAGGTFIYDKFFNKDGSALESGAAVVGTTALGYGGYKAIQGSYNVFKNRVSPGHPSQKAKAGSMVLSKKGNAMVAGKDGKATTQPFKGSQNKYPRLFGSKGFLSGIKGIAPLAVIGAAFAGNEVMGILNSSDSEEVKKQKVGAVLGPLMNETVLGIIGAGIGGMTVGPGGAIVGGIAGGALATFAPNLAGNALAEFLMGRSTMSESQQNQIKSPNYITRKVSNLGTGMNNGQFQDIGSTIGLISPIKAPRNNYNQKLKNKLVAHFDTKKIDQNQQIAKAETTVKPKKKTKVAKVEPKQEEFKPKKTNQDNEAPVIQIAEAITVNDASYEIEGSVTDKSDKIFVQINGRNVTVVKGKFKMKRFSPVDEEIQIIATDQWGNTSKPKIVSVIIDQKDNDVATVLETLDPSKIRSKSNKNKVALIIGIEKYDQTPEASYANLDAQYFYEYAKKGFGISKSNIKLLVDEDANLIKSLGTLNKWLPGKIKSGETELIIFFAGHGLASNDGKELYLLPQDSDPDLLARTALSRTELFKQIISLNPKNVTIFLDTCYSGVSRDEKTLLASARPVRIVADKQDTPNNFTIFSASQLDQISSGLKEAKHGIFSYYLMKGLEGKADANKDKDITNGELLAYMDQNVAQKASELGRQQNPSLAGDPDKILMSYR